MTLSVPRAIGTDRFQVRRKYQATAMPAGTNVRRKVSPQIPVSEHTWMSCKKSAWEYAMLPAVPWGEISDKTNSYDVHTVGKTRRASIA